MSTKEIFDDLQKAYETSSFNVDTIQEMTRDYMNNLMFTGKIKEYSIDINKEGNIIKCFITFTKSNDEEFNFTTYIQRRLK